MSGPSLRVTRHWGPVWHGYFADPFVLRLANGGYVAYGTHPGSDGDRVFETYWTTRRGVEAMDYSYALMDLTVYGRQELWEDSPPGWPHQWQPDAPKLMNGRPIAQWSRLEAGRSDDLGAAGR